MRIIEPSWELALLATYRNFPGGANYFFHELLTHVERETRISHRSEDRIEEGSAEKLLRQVVLGHGDWSVVEHASFTIEFVFDRGVTHELVRHRLFAFTQESTRFVNYEKKMPPSFIYPQVAGEKAVRCELCLGGDQPERLDRGEWFHTNGAPGQEPCAYDHNWLNAIATCEYEYKALLAKKWRPQEARSVFPNALASKIGVAGNVRNWRHAMIMRTTAETHPQFSAVMIPLLTFLKSSPLALFFEDIEPMAKQSENLKKAR